MPQDFFRQRHHENLDHFGSDEVREWEKLPEVFEKAQEYLEKRRINPLDFNHPPYSEDSIKKDIQRAREMEIGFEHQMRKSPEDKKRKQMSVVLEASFYRGINEHAWLGKDAKSVVASKYDDYVNHTDAIVQIKNELGMSSNVALGIDVSFSSKHVGDAISKIADAIRNNKLNEVRYFKSPDGAFQGQLEHAPRIVLGADITTLHSLVEQLGMGNNQFLERHWLQYQSLQIAKTQCEIFEKIARNRSQRIVVDQYGQLALFFGRTLDAAKKTAPYAVGEKDNFFEAVEKGLASA